MYSQQEPEYLLIQPTARHESAAIDREMELIASQSGHRFVMAAFWVDDWALGLMPWHDDAVSRREAVGQHGTDTLRYVCDVLMPWLGRHYGPLPVVLGGYSLGGLFALWASCLCEGICGVARRVAVGVDRGLDGVRLCPRHEGRTRVYEPRRP